MAMPSTLIGKAVGDVFYPRIADASHRGEHLLTLILKATLVLAAVGFLPFAVVIGFGPWFFGLVFGAEWVQSGEYARWLSLWLFFMFLNSPAVMALPVLNAQRFHLIFTLFTLAFRVLALATGYYVFQSDLLAVALFGVSGAILNFALVAIVILLAWRYDKIHSENVQ